MKVVELHPEELIDKLSTGELSDAERERLDSHLAQCSACRFEIGVRAELEQEAQLLEVRPQLALPGVPGGARHASGIASIRPRSRRRWPLVLLAAALVLCAGGATAAVLTGAVKAPWLPWVPESKPAPAAVSTSPKVASKPKRVAQKPAPVPEAALDPSADAVAILALAPSAEAPALTSASSSAPASSAAASGASAKHAPKASLAPANSARASAQAAFSSAPPAADAPSPGVEDGSLHVDPAASLFAEANRARRDGNADRAVSLYRSLQSRYPSSSESALSRALLAQLLLDRGSPEAALAGFDRYLAEDAPVLGAEALVGRARALEQLGKTTQANAAWREVEQRFPGSVHARLAAARLAALGMR